MCLSVCSRSSACATLGSYSISACSCVKLTATLSTPGRLPSAFSIVPVHNEQCSPPIRARIRRRPGTFEGSSLQKCGVDSTVVAVLMMTTPFQCQGLSCLSPKAIFASQPQDEPYTCYRVQKFKTHAIWEWGPADSTVVPVLMIEPSGHNCL